MNKFLFLFIFSISFSFGQDKNTSKMEDKDVPFAIVERAPIYPGCFSQDDNVIKKCTSERIDAFVSTNFNMRILDSLGLPPNKYRFSVQFKIDTLGNIVDINSRAPHPIIKEESIRVVNSLPKFSPGEQKGEMVNTLYVIPIEIELPFKK